MNDTARQVSAMSRRTPRSRVLHTELMVFILDTIIVVRQTERLDLYDEP